MTKMSNTVFTYIPSRSKSPYDVTLSVFTVHRQKISTVAWCRQQIGYSVMIVARRMDVRAEMCVHPHRKRQHCNQYIFV